MLLTTVFHLGTPAFDKILLITGNTRLESGIKKLSPDTQTSCLEGFHATLNHWHPKMLCFSWLGSYCRYVLLNHQNTQNIGSKAKRLRVCLLNFRTVLAVLHFNENLKREGQQTKTGDQYIKVTYPKYKLGEETVRDVKRPPTYSKQISFILFIYLSYSREIIYKLCSKLLNAYQ